MGIDNVKGIRIKHMTEYTTSSDDRTVGFKRCFVFAAQFCKNSEIGP